MERIIVDRTVEKYREQLQGLRVQAEQARQQIGTTELSPAFRDELQDIAGLAATYQPVQGATGAVYTLAQVTDRLTRLMQPWLILRRYAEMQDKLREVEVMYG